MGRDGNEASKPELPFEVWKSLLQKDCEVHNKLMAFQAFGDSVLEILWQSGLHPSVKALLDSGSEQSPARISRGT